MITQQKKSANVTHHVYLDDVLTYEKKGKGGYLMAINLDLKQYIKTYGLHNNKSYCNRVKGFRNSEPVRKRVLTIILLSFIQMKVLFLTNVQPGSSIDFYVDEVLEKT